MAYEVIEHDGVRYAEIIWAGTAVETTRFFSPPASSFQFGLLAHGAGFVESAHRHHSVRREITDVQQMFVLQRGVVDISFYKGNGELLRKVRLRSGDAINLIDGAHAVEVIEDMQGISIKQGPFLGDQLDKIDVETL